MYRLIFGIQRELIIQNNQDGLYIVLEDSDM